MTAIAAKNIEIAYSGHAQNRVLLRDFDLELHPGDLLAVIGANGAGKSSLLRVLAGLQEPQSGHVKWQGRDLTDIPRRERPRLAAGLFSDFARVPGLTVFDLVALGRQPYAGLFGGLSFQDHTSITKAMDMTGVAHLAGDQVIHLSDGEFKKALLAKLLAQDTPILILDEPAAHLDVPAAIELMVLMRSLVADLGKTVVFTSHELAMVFQMVDQVLLLGGNGDYALGAPDYISKHAMMCAFLKTDRVRFENGNLIMNFERK